MTTKTSAPEVEIIRYQVLIPVTEVQVRTAQAKDMEAHYLWELIHLKNPLHRRSEKVYHLSNRYSLVWMWCGWAENITLWSCAWQHCRVPQRFPQNHPADHSGKCAQYEHSTGKAARSVRLDAPDAEIRRRQRRNNRHQRQTERSAPFGRNYRLRQRRSLRRRRLHGRQRQPTRRLSRTQSNDRYNQTAD